MFLQHLLSDQKQWWTLFGRNFHHHYGNRQDVKCWWMTCHIRNMEKDWQPLFDSREQRESIRTKRVDWSDYWENSSGRLHINRTRQTVLNPWHPAWRWNASIGGHDLNNESVDITSEQRNGWRQQIRSDLTWTDCHPCRAIGLQAKRQEPRDG